MLQVASVGSRVNRTVLETPPALRILRSMSTDTTAELECSDTTAQRTGFDARQVLAGNVDDTTVRQAASGEL